MDPSVEKPLKRAQNRGGGGWQTMEHFALDRELAFVQCRREFRSLTPKMGELLGDFASFTASPKSSVTSG
jgi:hypothetical protein